MVLPRLVQLGKRFPGRDFEDFLKSLAPPPVAEKAFEYVFNDVGVESVMFGMGTIEQVTETATAARSVLGLRS